ncbi:MAG: type IV pilin protein [Gemmatimonadales bacterium]
MRDTRGFTLIELMVAISILGILASIALPRYSYLRQRAYVTAMQSDLRNLMSAQEGYFSSNGDYAGAVTSGPEVPGTGGSGSVSHVFSEGVVLVRMRYRSNARRGSGWNAVVRHTKVRDRTTDRCGIFMGFTGFSPNRAVTQPGVMACW